MRNALRLLVPIGLACSALTAQRHDLDFVPVTVYKMQASAPEPVAIREGGAFSVRLASISRHFKPKGNVMVRVFEGTKAELIKQRDSPVGTCYRFDPFTTFDGHIDGYLDLKDITAVDDTWLDCSHGPCASKRFVLVPEDGKITATPLYIDEESIAAYFNGGIEVEVRPGGAVRRVSSEGGGTAVISVGERGDGGTNVGADISSPASQPITITCYKFAPGPGTEVAKENGTNKSATQIAEVRTCATF